MGEHWDLFLWLAGLVTLFAGFILGVTRYMLKGTEAAVGKRCDEIGEGLQKVRRLEQEMAVVKASLPDYGETARGMQQLERELMALKADLPLSYVRREDFIRHEVVINTKLDRLRDLIEDIKKEMRNDGTNRR
jgi:cell shape-determining protein MreC